MLARLPRRAVLGAALLLLGLSHWLPGPSYEEPAANPAAALPLPPAKRALEGLAPGVEAADDERGCRERSLRTPSGSPPRLACAEARGITAELHARYAGPSAEPEASSFGELVAGWLDPHGLWSAAPDSPIAHGLRRRAAALLTELRESPQAQSPCGAAYLVGVQLQRWMDELHESYEAGRRRALSAPASRAFKSLSEAIFQDDPVTRPARVLARQLGERAGLLAATHPALGAELASASKSRYLPELSAEAWAEVVLAAAVRAYVPLLDPHGAWAPFEEEWSLYSDDPGFEGGPRLWGEVTRTAVGVRILSDALPPLGSGDLVLSVDGIATGGMPLEQIEQLGRVEGSESVRRVLALRAQDSEPRQLSVDVRATLDPGEESFALEGESVRYGGGHVLLIRIPDVPEGLGETLGRLIAERRDASLRGVVLDLRGNGGGSTEGASSVLGVFLPGAPLFPLAARGRLVEVMRASVPQAEQRFSGPVAAIVDGYTASAAEMIAGGLAAYGRAVVLGRRTFGKGCIQEYADDHTGRGVLRVTTLLYALPDGSAVQRSGLVPNLFLPVDKARDREADVGGALPGYVGPDVREMAPGPTVAWPSHGGDVGPHADAVITAALRRLGAKAQTRRAVAARRVSARAPTAYPSQRAP